MEPTPVAEPYRGEELLRDLAAVRRWSADFWRGFPREEFFAPIGEGWSPADHVRHLVKSNRPVAMALGLPKLVLRFRFGAAKRPSRRYSELVAIYKQALADGLEARQYAASPLPPERHTDEQREQSLTTLDETFAALARPLARWSERSLDHLCLPHPGIGLLTVREMAFFTLYHNTHHVLGVAHKKGL